MTQQFHEQLSCLMDGELARDEARFVLRRLDHDHAMAANWSRYHVARHVLRRQPVMLVRSDFSSGVMALIGETVPQRNNSGRWLRWTSGGAIAAAVAVAALMVTQPGEEAQPYPMAATGIASAAPTGGVASVVVAPASEQRSPSPLITSQSAPIQQASVNTSTSLQSGVGGVDPRLQSYLIRHYEATGAVGHSGFVPYVLLVPQQEAKVRVPAQRVGQSR